MSIEGPCEDMEAAGSGRNQTSRGSTQRQHAELSWKAVVVKWIRLGPSRYGYCVAFEDPEAVLNGS